MNLEFYQTQQDLINKIPKGTKVIAALGSVYDYLFLKNILKKYDGIIISRSCL